jgi:mono/diheme cytochrome c family protein
MKASLAIFLLGSGCAVAADADIFRSKIAPAFEAKCVACHRPDNLKGGLDLTTREAILAGGDDGGDLAPGKPDASEIFMRAISHDGKKPKMPKKGEALTPDEAEALRGWIAAGAVWPEKLVLKEKAKADKTFWSFQPLSNAEPPIANDAPAGWRANPIDRFVFAKLAEKNLKPNPPADPRTFIRRATYDLTGLPPTPEEVEAFCQSAIRDPQSAIESLIDRLLASPHYGEHWGRHWLDVVRFGESRGFERNQIITNLWPFRDYVIRSFSDDKPFDQLVREHLAGDVIGKDQPDVEIGSAFLVAGPYDDVGNQDPVAAAQIRADTLDEMIRTTSEAFLGVTLGCARCHDHKFDPLLSRDYYSLYSTFAGTVHGERPVGTAEQVQAHNAVMHPMEVAKKKLTAERAEAEKRIASIAKASEADAEKFWPRPRASRYGTEEKFASVEAKYVRLIGEGTDVDIAKRNNFKLDEFEVWSAEASPRNVALASNGAKAEGDAREARELAGAYGAMLTIDGKFGERWQAAGDRLTIILAKAERIDRVYFSSDRKHELPEDHFLTMFPGEYRIEVSLDGKTWREVASSRDRQPITVARRQARLLARVPAEEKKRLAEIDAQLARVNADIAKVPPLPVWWVGTHRDAPGPFNVFLGGSPQRKGNAVVPASLSVFEGAKSSYRLDAAPEGERRVALAKWITSPENPLPSRVLANRVWHYHFGTGIVDTPSDFGYMGGRPTHPELLDWLARQLVSGGWKLKPLHRLIMTSQAYRQSGAWNETAAHADGDSRLLWRFPPRRLSAEEVRDTVLSVAGKLDLTMGGPGFKLYEYQQDNVATYVPLDIHGPETYRRAVYHHNARAARVDVMTDFDCPDPSYSEPRRATTTTPLQALTLMNHRFSLDMAAALAARLEKDAGDSVARVRRAFTLCYARDAGAEEIAGGVKLIEDFGLRAFCRAMLNTNELITVN